MSNFETLGYITEGNISTAPNEFYASTEDTYALITAAGYLNDISAKVKLNDLFYVNYLDTSTFPLSTGEASILTELKVAYNPGTEDWSLVPANLNQSGAALLSALGFHSAIASSTTTSATSTYSDSQVSAAAIAFARWDTAATPGGVEKVTPSAGLLTVVNSATSGVSSIAYFSIIGSLALQNIGIYTNQYDNAGGSATFTITDSLITASSIVVANFASSVNLVHIEKVTSTAGQIVVLCSGDPGVSVFSYLSVTPSTALTAEGCYAATYTNAGGSATITITDANILSTSVVMAEIGASANAVYIEKVTPSAGSLVILCSGDPGASTINYIATSVAEGSDPSGYLLAANNLSDVASASAALANLGGVPLTGGQLTGSLLAQKGTGSVSTGAVTINDQAGVITTGSLTTAATATTSVTFNNSKIVASSVILVSLMGGTNAIPGVQLSCVYASTGVATLNITNNNVAGSALSGTLIIGFAVL
jgi:hypothetical protein